MKHDDKMKKKDLQKFHEAAAGMLQFMMVRQHEIPGLIMASFSGEKLCTKAMQAVESFLQTTHAEKPLCATCDYEFDMAGRPPGGAFFLAFPLIETSGSAMVSAVCEKCAQKSDSQLHDKYKILLCRMWPGMQSVSPSRMSDDIGNG
jgi:hypothetical protein